VILISPFGPAPLPAPPLFPAPPPSFSVLLRPSGRHPAGFGDGDEAKAIVLSDDKMAMTTRQVTRLDILFTGLAIQSPSPLSLPSAPPCLATIATISTNDTHHADQGCLIVTVVVGQEGVQSFVLLSTKRHRQRQLRQGVWEPDVQGRREQPQGTQATMFTINRRDNALAHSKEEKFPFTPTLLPYSFLFNRLLSAPSGSISTL
jgi:hypothetical protein